MFPGLCPLLFDLGHYVALAIFLSVFPSFSKKGVQGLLHPGPLRVFVLPRRLWLLRPWRHVVGSLPVVDAARAVRRWFNLSYFPACSFYFGGRVDIDSRCIHRTILDVMVFRPWIVLVLT